MNRRLLPQFLWHLFGSEPAPTGSDELQVGLRHIAVDQPQGGTHYPFVLPDFVTNRVFADFYLTYSDPYCDYVKPFKLLWVYGFGADAGTTANPYSVDVVHNCEVLVVDANDAIVFDSSTVPDDSASYVEKMWGSDLKIVEWRGDENICRLVYRPNLDTPSVTYSAPLSFVPDNAELDERTLELIPLAVNAIKIAQEGAPAAFRDPYIKLAAGYNTRLDALASTAADGSRIINDIIINLEQGLGLGRFQGCTEDIVIRSIDNIPGDSAGNFIVQATDCYKLEVPYTIVEGEAVVTPHTLKLVNDCVTCCTCDQYVNVYEAVKKLRAKYVTIGQRAEGTRDQHRTNIIRWIESGRARAAKPLRASVQNGPEAILGVVGAYMNNTHLITNLEIRFSFVYSNISYPDITAATTVTGSIVPGTTLRSGNYSPADLPRPGGNATGHEPYVMSGTYPVFSAFFDSVIAGGQASVSFDMTFPTAALTDLVEVVVEVWNHDTGTPTRIQYQSMWPAATPLVDVTPVKVYSTLVPV